jgi:GrpB-like predicted nucleotidyltransferase (UPF0157 family)
MDPDERVTVVPYDEQWPFLFEMEKEKLRRVFVDDAVDIRHFGSTAVPGMAAKPIIDILVGVGTLVLDSAITNRLAELGYEGFGEAGVPGRLYFRKRREHAFNLAVVIRNGEHWTNNLRIRDYLRRNPEAARQYSEQKMNAIRSGHTTLLAYSDAKAGCVARLLELAKQDSG